MKMTGQGIRDLNDRGPKKKPVEPAASVEPEASTEPAANVETTAAVPPPAAKDATTPAVVHHG
jgi:hypothetical protein